MKAGIDCGSKFLKIIIASDDKGEGDIIYREHQGNPEACLRGILDDSGLILEPVITGSLGGLISPLFEESRSVEEISALLEALGRFDVDSRYVVNVGSGSIRLVERDHAGNFKSYRENSLCAAGTGSFVDEQMHRLGLVYADIPDLPIDTDPPSIATRCAVFAKSDMIHRQQEGYRSRELWSGLCRGVSTTMLQSVFRGDIPREEIFFCGGMFLNPAVRYWTGRMVPGARFHESGHLFPAWGCFYHEGARGIAVPDGFQHSDAPTGKTRGPRLEVRMSPEVKAGEVKEYVSGGCEIRVHGAIPDGAETSLGIDIGSTSTKLVLIESTTGDVLLDIYTRTSGNPIEATGRLFAETKRLLDGKNARVLSVGTTGSGRKLVGALTGADVIVNEITAHFTGARRFDPEVETIFEIGGQDSKYIRGRDGMVVDCNMNFVCAAGTGSFIEEQANRLGFPVSEIGGKVLGLEAPHASDRCTVFMEQDINKLLRENHSREEALASVVYSIARNYLSRVVGTRPVTGKRIFFQGATARNRGLVAAFESLLEKEITVSPLCHVMGAFGAALLAKDRLEGATRFRGLEVFRERPEITYERCGDCENSCAITHAVFSDGTGESWGHLCGKEKSGTARRASMGGFRFIERRLGAGKSEALPAASARRGTVGIPAALSMFTYLPLWKTFLERLGFAVVTSTFSNPASRERATGLAGTDFCYPVKIALAHYEELALNDAVDFIFFPSAISEKNQASGTPRIFCPYVISFASMASALGLDTPLLSPVIDFRDADRVITAELHRVLGEFGISREEVNAAYGAAGKELADYFRERKKKGDDVLSRARDGRPAVVFIGRPYNLYDTVINLKLPERFRSFDVDILPYELLIEPGAETNIHHMYWNYGELILSAAEKIRAMENVYPVYLTNFSCGPDSFILSRFESIMAGKPYLIIELDEHGSETGYVTRIEAFMDIVNEGRRGRRDAAVQNAAPFSTKWRSKGRKLWIPPMHEIAARLFAAGFRAWGFDSEALPVENLAAFETGKRNIRGGECLPAATTIGAFINMMKETGADPARQAIFMPTAEGPCRFGQYSVLHRSILDRLGYKETSIFAPSSVNSYMGMPQALRIYLWDLVISADMIMKAVCKVRPYEIEKGSTDRIAEEMLVNFEARAEKRQDLIPAALDAVRGIFSNPVTSERRPLVGVVGEIYVRCNPFCNNNVIRVIENFGGEAWLAPISEWVLYTSWFEKYYADLTSRNPINKALVGLKNHYLFKRERLFEEALAPLLSDRFEHHVSEVVREGERYLPLRFEGEAILTMGRTELFLRDGADMVVNCAPFGCMPGNITSALFGPIREKYGKPILTLFYDGESNVNRVMEVYLGNMESRKAELEAMAVAP